MAAELPIMTPAGIVGAWSSNGYKAISPHLLRHSVY